MGNLLGLMSIATAVFFLVISKKRSTEDERARQNKSAYSPVLYTSYNNNDGKLMKFKRINSENNFEEYMFFCPGCGYYHWVRVSGDHPCWMWNGDVSSPTISPSLLVNQNTDQCCHSFITDGKMQYLGDCSHNYKGQTLEIPDWEED